MSSTGTADLFEKRLTHQRVRERERAGNVGDLPEQARSRCLVESDHRLLAGYACRSGDGGQVEPHGPRLPPPREGRSLTHPTAKAVARRHHERPREDRGRRGLGRWSRSIAPEDGAGFGEVGNDFLGEERVAVGLVVQSGDELGWRIVTHTMADDRADRLLLKATQSHPLDAGDTPEVGEQLAQRIAAVDIGVTVGAQDQHRPAAFAAQDPTEQPQRRRVGPVEIVEHQQQRAGAAHPRRAASTASNSCAPDLTLHRSSASPRHRAHARRRPRCTARDRPRAASKPAMSSSSALWTKPPTRAPTPRTRSSTPSSHHPCSTTPRRRQLRRPPPAASRVLPMPGSPATSTSQHSRAVTALFPRVAQLIEWQLAPHAATSCSDLGESRRHNHKRRVAGAPAAGLAVSVSMRGSRFAIMRSRSTSSAPRVRARLPLRGVGGTPGTTEERVGLSAVAIERQHELVPRALS